MTVIDHTVPPPRRHGCLWGCLIVLAIFFLPAALAAGYTAWFFYEGYRHDPVLRGVVELVRHDGMAEQALGENIHITGVEGSALSYMWGQENSAYAVTLEGSKGHGDLHVIAGLKNGHLDVQRMTLDGPDGTEYDLMHHTLQQNSNAPTTAI